MFKEDVGQVLAWLTEHGEPFLARQIAVGKSSQRAEQLYNAHMQFEQVAANTLTNADKLISAAEELAVQAENPREIRLVSGIECQVVSYITGARLFLIMLLHASCVGITCGLVQCNVLNLEAWILQLI